MVRCPVVGDEEIDAAVAVEITGDDAEPVADRRAQTGAFRHVAESAVAVVVIERSVDEVGRS